MAQVQVQLDLHVGLLALQEGLIDRATLVAALEAWSRDPAVPIPERLLAEGHLGPDRLDRLRGLVDRPRSGPGRPAGDATIDGPARTAPDPAATTRVVPHPDATAAHPGSTEPAETIDFGAGPDGDDCRSRCRAEGPDRGHASGQSSGLPGRFRILRRHARGGLGEVFVALDGELNREVALKRILPEQVDDPRSRARFLAEAEITGGLEHPGIVPVYGLGADGSGRPFYAMRLVRGGTLKEAIDTFHGGPPTPGAGSRSLALRELLRRFGDACGAVDYAHGRGVLHRDLKPSNIALGPHGETVVLDWGLAKATGRAEPSGVEPALCPRAADLVAGTLEGSALGTPAFMSPEAAAGDLRGIEGRSDVYSLGATLYCILTGRPPFAGEDLPALLGRIRAGGFLRPRSVAPAVDPALEAVCLRAMSLRAADRYGTAGALADELRRWAADEPVLACREGRRRRVARWVRRHASAVAAGGALLATAAVTLGLAAILIAAERDRVAQARARLAATNIDLERTKGQAEGSDRLARDVIRRLMANIVQFDLTAVSQAEPLRLSLAEDAAGFYRVLHERTPGDPRAGQELARLEVQAGAIRRSMGDYASARARFDAASRLLRPGPGAGPRRSIAREYLAHVEDQIGELIKMSGGPIAEAEPHYRESVALAADLSGRFPDQSHYASLDARVNADLAYLLLDAGRFDEAEPVALRAAERGRAFDASLPAGPFVNDRLILPVALQARALLLARRGRPGAEAAAAEVVRACRDLEALAPEQVDVQYHLADGLNELAGVIAADPGRRPEALLLQDQAIGRVEKLAAGHPLIKLYPWSLAKLRRDRGIALAVLGRLDPARVDLERACPALQAEVDRVGGAASLEALGRAIAGLARIERDQGRVDAARRRYLEAIARHDEALAIDPGASLNGALRRADRDDLEALARPR